jgi:hypothetical protein
MIDAADVLARATDVVEWLNGLGRVESAGFCPISAGHVVRVHEDGRRNFFVICRGEISVGRGRLSAMGYVVRPDGRISSDSVPIQPSVSVKRLALAGGRPEVAQVLRILGQPEGRTAAGLWKIWEIVAADVAQSDNPRTWNSAVMGRGWATAQELDSLRSLHDPSVLGDAARHAVHTRNSPAVRWALSDVDAFIRRQIMNWLG